ncbi:lipopolysaccharide assembly protein LapB [Idiomarina aminovorans]|uniref:lipopolysaccharide assembly protein LapB n=1 Tax=Idiomarina aminovorans TaxID=2914829 RepID=UPI002004C561|nr:lipopolysaccharide assembly protein LapB [Idiomarina sp. ATCH4]MCK7458532.1 lipopolysaccharide assembly protein LapB [Idiomarina sp. ATCH4]
MLELLFLLLPIAAAYGWFMGRNSVRTEERKEQKRFSKQYATGINLLLSDQPDKAVDLFVELLDVDSETIETHWTLGKLFRRRGEIDRAIKIHKNLTSLPNLTEHDRLTAMYELGKDYLSAGIYDRAEQMFAGLQSYKLFREKSQKHLLELYESTHEWDKAIKIGLRLAKQDSHARIVLAQLYCELAELDDNILSKIKHYNKALKHDGNCVRAVLSLGKIYMREGEYGESINYLTRVFEQDKSFVCETVPLLQEAFEKTSDTHTFVEFLHNCVEQNAGITAAITLSEKICESQSIEDAEHFMTQVLEQHPTMRGFHYLMGLHIRAADVGNARDSLRRLRKMVHEHIVQRPNYKCRHCGFSGHTLYWRCPSCKSWTTTKPIFGLDGE